MLPEGKMCIKRISIFLAILAVVAISVALMPQRVMAGDDWHAEFFDNQTLSGSPRFTRTDRWIGFEWGNDAPAPGMSSEHFSARWTRSLWLPGNSALQFCAMADDGVRIWVDDVVVLDEWHGNNGIAYCGSQHILLKGTHQIRVEYYEDAGEALIYVWWEGVEPASPYIPVIPSPEVKAYAPSLTRNAPAPFEGWYGEYFGNRSLAGKPDYGRLDAAIGFEWGGGGEPFSVRWRRSVEFNEGYYRFCAMADDGVRIWVDGALFLDEWHDNYGLVYCKEHWVTAGVHQVHVEYYENWGNALIYVWWQRFLPRNVGS
jgi:hypothetical protein